MNVGELSLFLISLIDILIVSEVGGEFPPCKEFLVVNQFLLICSIVCLVISFILLDLQQNLIEGHFCI